MQTLNMNIINFVAIEPILKSLTQMQTLSVNKA